MRRLWAQDRLRWGIHASIAYSFLGLFFIGSIGDMFSELGAPLGKDDAWFALTNDVLGLTLLAGVVAALVRRRSTSAPASGFEDYGALFLLGGLAASGFFVEAARIVESDAASGHAFVGSALASTLDALSLHSETVHDVAWWSHGLVALGLVTWLPYSKLRHVVASPLAYAESITSVPATPAPASLLRDGGFAFPQALAFDACTRCGLCLRACGSYAATGVEGSSVYGMIGARRALFARNEDRARDALRDAAFDCTLCGRCQEVCPVGIKTRDVALAVRQELATARCMLPKNLDLARDAVREENNVFRFPNEDRALWTDFMDDLPDDLLTKEKADVLYYVGCVSSFSPAVQEIPQAFLQLLLRAGLDVALLGGKEWCCGFPMIMGGLPDEADHLIEHNIAEVRRLGAKTIVFNCPSCYYTWKRYYALPGVRLLHATQLVRELVEEGRLRFDGAPDGGVTYHDPCDLGRGSGEFAAPREVLRGLVGEDFVELTPSGRLGLCCGGGGDVEMWSPDVVATVNRSLVDAVQATGAGLLVQGCPQCKRVTQRGLQEAGSKVRTLDIAELALEYGTFVRPEDLR